MSPLEVSRPENCLTTEGRRDSVLDEQVYGSQIVRSPSGPAEKLPAAVREEFRKTALQTGREIKENGRKEGDEAVKAMEKRGLTVTPVDAALESEWRRAAEAAYPSIRGKIVPADIFDEALKHIAEYRARQPGK